MARFATMVLSFSLSAFAAPATAAPRLERIEVYAVDARSGELSPDLLTHAYDSWNGELVVGDAHHFFDDLMVKIELLAPGVTGEQEEYTEERMRLAFRESQGKTSDYEREWQGIWLHPKFFAFAVVPNVSCGAYELSVTFAGQAKESSLTFACGE